VNNRITVAKHFDKKLNYALLNEAGKKVFINVFEDRLNQTFEHPKLKSVFGTIKTERSGT